MNKGIIPNTLPKFIFSLRKKGKMIVSGTNGAGGNGERWEFPKVMSPSPNVIKGNNHPVKKEQCECGHDQYQHMGMDTCQICTCKAFSSPTPHAEAWEEDFDKHTYDTLKGIMTTRNEIQSKGVCIGWDSDKVLTKKMIIHFIHTLLHQTYEETVREMERIIGKDEWEDPDIKGSPQTGGDMVIKSWRRNGLRAEQRQRLAQYTNSKGGI